jgi:hypothetical protein
MFAVCRTRYLTSARKRTSRHQFEFTEFAAPAFLGSEIHVDTVAGNFDDGPLVIAFDTAPAVGRLFADDAHSRTNTECAPC